MSANARRVLCSSGNLKNAEAAFSGPALRQILSAHVSAGTSLMVAYSGGVDSHVLLYALYELRELTSWSVRAVHVDHGLQPESRAWAEHCMQVCDALGIPCKIEHIAVTGARAEGIEAAARHLRYACLARHIGANDVLLTAHHLDDQAETVLLQLLRGSGVRGLSAMPMVAGFGVGKLMRPLLGFTRTALSEYAAEHGLRWVDDTSNRDLRHARNFIRHRVLPVLEQRWPSARAALARTSRHAGEAAMLLDALAGVDLQSLQLGAGAELSVTGLLQLSVERRRNVLRYWIRQQGHALPSTLLLGQLMQIIEVSTRSRSAMVTWGDTEVWRYRETLSIMRSFAAPDPGLQIPWDLAVPLELPGTGYVLRSVACDGEGLSRGRIAGAPLTVRWRGGGERCRLPGRRHHHKLKKLLQAAGVPPWERRRLPLIFVGAELAAVADRWVCAPFAARDGEPGVQIVLERVKNRV